MDKRYHLNQTKQSKTLCSEEQSEAINEAQMFQRWMASTCKDEHAMLQVNGDALAPLDGQQLTSSERRLLNRATCGIWYTQEKLLQTTHNTPQTQRFRSLHQSPVSPSFGSMLVIESSSEIHSVQTKVHCKQLRITMTVMISRHKNSQRVIRR